MSVRKSDTFKAPHDRTAALSVTLPFRMCRDKCVITDTDMLRLDNLEAAIQDYTAALSLDPGNSINFHNRGTLYERLGR